MDIVGDFLLCGGSEIVSEILFNCSNRCLRTDRSEKLFVVRLKRIDEVRLLFGLLLKGLQKDFELLVGFFNFSEILDFVSNEIRNL